MPVLASDKLSPSADFPSRRELCARVASFTLDLSREGPFDASGASSDAGN